MFHDTERIRAALDYIRSQPAGVVRNRPGLLRHLVEADQPIPDPAIPWERDPDKYISGRYGHLVNR